MGHFQAFRKKIYVFCKNYSAPGKLSNLSFQAGVEHSPLAASAYDRQPFIKKC